MGGAYFGLGLIDRSVEMENLLEKIERDRPISPRPGTRRTVAGIGR